MPQLFLRYLLLFQSTHSLRSATLEGMNCKSSLRFQSTHSLRSATDSALLKVAGGPRFNPRTPCGVRRQYAATWARNNAFQSTHSLRSATRTGSARLRLGAVSIHALLAECDLSISYGRAAGKSFNPRTPCGVRPSPSCNHRPWYRVSIHALLAECDSPSSSVVISDITFQSTHSLRSATPPFFQYWRYHNVSIHALLAECDKLLAIR